MDNKTIEIKTEIEILKQAISRFLFICEKSDVDGKMVLMEIIKENKYDK